MPDPGFGKSYDHDLFFFEKLATYPYPYFLSFFHNNFFVRYDVSLYSKKKFLDNLKRSGLETSLF